MSTRFLLFLSALALIGCGASRAKVGGAGGDGSSGNGGRGATGGSGGSAGSVTAGAGGSAGGSAGVGGAGVGGAGGGTPGGSGGVAASAGEGGSGGSSAGTPGEMGGEAGEPSGAGTAGSAGAAGGAGGTGDDAEPSPGCALGNATPETTLAHYDGTRVRLPPGYDGSTPFPLLLGFHETNIPGQILSRFPATHPLAQSYVTVAPEKSGIVGNFESDNRSKVVPLLDEVLSTFCVDQRSLFTVGQGSGGRYLGKILCEGRPITTAPDVRFRAAAIMGAYSGCSTWPALPLLFVHGLNAGESQFLAQDGDGQKALAKFSTNGACGTTSTPHAVGTCNSAANSVPLVTPACVDFDGCTAPFRYCAHDDPAQSNSGWPCFASNAVYEFFESQRPD